MLSLKIFKGLRFKEKALPRGIAEQTLSFIQRFTMQITRAGIKGDPQKLIAERFITERTSGL